MATVFTEFDRGNLRAVQTSRLWELLGLLLFLSATAGCADCRRLTLRPHNGTTVVENLPQLQRIAGVNPHVIRRGVQICDA